MKYPFLFASLLFLPVSALAQNTFEMTQGDTTYVMQEYFMAFLNAGPTRTQDSTESAQIQEAHMAHLNRMSEDGYVSIVGPFGDAGDTRGICIYNTATIEEADSLANMDPAVQAGQLQIEVRSWWCAKGSRLK